MKKPRQVVPRAFLRDKGGKCRIKSRAASAGSCSSQGPVIHLLVIVHCFMLRGMYNSCRR